MENEEEIPEEDHFSTVRRAPIRNIGDIRKTPTTHAWVNGKPYIDGENFARTDICSKCGCNRQVLMKPNQRPWFNLYVLNGEESKTAPICKPIINN